MKELVKQLGGKTWIESTPAQISSYWFTVDIQPKNHSIQTESAKPETGKHPDWSDKTILIVEDVYNNVLLLETILQPTKARVVNVENGLKAINIVKRNDHINFVLMDLRLPVLDGFEATSRIKVSTPLALATSSPVSSSLTMIRMRRSFSCLLIAYAFTSLEFFC